MKLPQILSRITGISCPVFGIQWNPPEAERDIARRVIAFLEDRRVLYVPSEAEVPMHCVDSVLKIRDFLTKELESINSSAGLAKSLMAMRSACRKFLNQSDGDNGKIIIHGAMQGHYCSWIFLSSLGELRGVFGIHIAQICVSYGLDIEDDLATILPAPIEGNEGE